MRAERRYDVEAARKNLPSLVEQANRGKASLITKHGKVYAAIVPPSYVRHGKRGVGIGALRGTGKGYWGRSASRAIAKMRDDKEFVGPQPDEFLAFETYHP